MILYMYISEQPDFGTLLVTTGLHGSSQGFLDIFCGSGHELMHPEAYLELLATAEQVSDVKNIARGLFSLILLTFVSVSAYLVFLCYVIRLSVLSMIPRV